MLGLLEMMGLIGAGIIRLGGEEGLTTPIVGGELELITPIVGGELVPITPIEEEEEVRRWRGGELTGLRLICMGGEREEGEEEGKRGCPTVGGEAGEDRSVLSGLVVERVGLEVARWGGEGRGEVEGLEAEGWSDFSDDGLGEQSGEEKLPPEEEFRSLN